MHKGAKNVSALRAAACRNWLSDQGAFIYYCFSFVLNCFLNKHGRAQRRNNFSTFLPMFFCISMNFLMKVAARSAEKFKTLQFVVSSLQQKSQVLEILNFVVYNRTCSLRDLSNSDFCSL